MYDIAAFGEILIDFTEQGGNENGQKLFVRNPGGAPANMLTAAAHLGAKTAFLGKVGTDMHGRFLKETLEREKVDTTGLLLDENFFTTLAFVALNPQGERSFSFARKPGADTQMTSGELREDIIKNTRIFHVGSLSMTDEPAYGTTVYAVKLAKQSGAIISYDPNYRAALWKNNEVAKQKMRSLIPFVDVMKISDEETELLTGEKMVEKAAEVLLAQGVKIAAITLGSDGAYVRTKEGGSKIKGFLSTAVDTTGAGDSFWGGFLYKICESGKRLEEIRLSEVSEFTLFANSVASLCVERQGGIPAMPYKNEVLERLQNLES